jgi:hypothetical protein
LDAVNLPGVDCADISHNFELTNFDRIGKSKAILMQRNSIISHRE